MELCSESLYECDGISIINPPATRVVRRAAACYVAAFTCGSPSMWVSVCRHCGSEEVGVGDFHSAPSEGSGRSDFHPTPTPSSPSSCATTALQL